MLLRPGILIFLLCLTGCKNPLGGDAKSTVDSTHRPGNFAPPTTEPSTNASPTISVIALQSTTEDTPTVAIGFTINDSDSTLTCDSATLSLTSDTSALISTTDVTWGGVAPNCTAILSPRLNQFGSAEVMITVQDDAVPPLTASQSFTLNVAAVNDAPTLTGFAAVTTNEDVVSSPLALTLMDVDSALTCAGALSGSSATTSVIANSGIVFGGVVPNCTVTLTPVANAYGTSIVTVTASDGALSASGTFTATVNPLADDPLTGLPWDFGNSASYVVGTGAEVNSGSNGLAQLIRADIVDDSTSATGGDLDFSGYVSKSANVSVSGGKLNLGTASASDAASTGATYSGEFLSRVMDGRTTAIDWGRISKTTLLPFGKEISLGAETGYGSSVTDFSANLMANFRMNEAAAGSGAGGTDIIDQRFGNNGTRTGTPTFAQAGILGRSISLSGGNQFFTVPDSVNLDGSAVLTFSVWFNPSLVDTSPRGIISKRVSTSSEYAYSLFLHTGSRLYVDTEGTTNRFSGGTVIAANQWYHAVVVFDGSLPAASRTRLYLNGRLDGTGPGPASISNRASNLFIGTLNDAYGTYFQGRIDEVAVWKRTMTAEQVAELYRRGANRVSLQVRACDDAACTTGAPAWVGADGTSTGTFSEVRNTADGALTGAVSALPFAVSWATLRATYTAFNTWAAATPFGTIVNIRKRYMQYRAVLESFESTTSTLCSASNVYSAAGTRPCVPEISKVEFGADRYDSSMPAVTTRSSAPDAGVEFYSLTGFSRTLGAGSCSGDRYQLALNGTSTWYYHNGTTWVVVPDSVTGSSADTINSNISTFPTVVGRGRLYVRALLASTGSAPCVLDSMTVTGGK